MRRWIVLLFLPSAAFAQTGGAQLGVPPTIQRIEADIARQNDRADALAKRMGTLEDRVRYFEERIINLLERQQQQHAAPAPRQDHRRRRITK